MRYPFVKLAKRDEMALYLIKEELKTRKFFNRLAEVGFLDDDAQAHLHALIAECLEVDIQKDEDFSRFEKILEDSSAEIAPDMDNEELMNLVLKVYSHIVQLRAEPLKNGSGKSAETLSKKDVGSAESHHKPDSDSQADAEQDEATLSPELAEEVEWFFTHISPKHFSRALRDATNEISAGCEEGGVPLYLNELLDGLQLFFHVLDKAEDEGKYSDKDMYER